MIRSLVVANTVLALVSPLALAAPPVWETPTCPVVTGAPPVATYTNNDGLRLTPLSRPPRGTVYTTALLAQATPNRLLAIQNNTLYYSSDAGCRWAPLARAARIAQPGMLSAGPGTRAYAWTDGGGDLLRIDDLVVSALRSPVSAIVGLGVDPQDGDHLRLAAQNGAIWESRTGGARWALLAAAPENGSLFVYRASFDPRNLEHIVLGTAVEGGFVSLDGGQVWTRSQGLAADGRANLFTAVIASADPNSVYAMGINLAESDAGAPSGGRHIYASLDGGFNFSPVVDNSADVTLVNGPVMAVHPMFPDRLYFVFGTSFQNYGTDLYRFDRSGGTVTKTHNSYHRIPALAFHPVDPQLLYLGIANEVVR